MAHSASDLASNVSMDRYEQQEQRKSFVGGRDSIWFYQDQITVPEVMKAIPFGKFQKMLTVVFLVSFLATSTISFNFAFFLMPQRYHCPVGEVKHASAAAISTIDR